MSSAKVLLDRLDELIDYLVVEGEMTAYAGDVIKQEVTFLIKSLNKDRN